MALRFGLNVWALTAPADNSILPLFDQVKAMGFDSIELPVEAVGVLDARKVAAKLKETGLHGIACGVFGPDRDLTNDDPTVRRNCLNYAKGALKFAEAIGANRLIGPMYAAVGKRRMVSAEQKKIEWERAVKGLRQAGQVAADRGVVIAIEALNRFETDLINTAEQAVQLVKDVGLKSVGIHLDTFHMNIEEKSTLAAIRTAGPHLAHVHACESDRGTPGTGQVHWKELARGLKDVGYEGDVVIESFTPANRALAAAVCIWRPIAPSQEALATGGLKFLKKLLA